MHQREETGRQFITFLTFLAICVAVLLLLIAYTALLAPLFLDPGRKSTVTDWLLVAITGLYAGVTWAQWRALRDTLDHNRESSEKQLRAYVFVERGELWNYTPGHPTPNATPREIETVSQSRDKGPIAYLQILNSGQTPAYDAEVLVDICVADFPVTPPLPPIRRGSYGYKIIIGPRAHVEHMIGMDAPLDAAARAKINSGDLAVYVWGEITYLDGFDARITTTFRFLHAKYSLGTHDLSPTDEGTTERREK